MKAWCALPHDCYSRWVLMIWLFSGRDGSSCWKCNSKRRCNLVIIKQGSPLFLTTSWTAICWGSLWTDGLGDINYSVDGSIQIRRGWLVLYRWKNLRSSSGEALPNKKLSLALATQLHGMWGVGMMSFHVNMSELYLFIYLFIIFEIKNKFSFYNVFVFSWYWIKQACAPWGVCMFKIGIWIILLNQIHLVKTGFHVRKWTSEMPFYIECTTQIKGTYWYTSRRCWPKQVSVSENFATQKTPVMARPIELRSGRAERDLNATKAIWFVLMSSNVFLCGASVYWKLN